MMTQRQAVFAAIKEHMELDGSPVLDRVTDKQLDAIKATLFNMFTSQQVELKGVRTADWLKKYIPGLINNWMRKDTNLNGGAKYEAKNPGSRTGSGDEQIKAMKALLSQPSLTTEQRAEVEAAIEERKAAIKPQPEPINVAALPESLRHLVK
jgi:hypothetical protein